jgi:hypothetical protein
VVLVITKSRDVRPNSTNREETYEFGL